MPLCDGRFIDSRTHSQFSSFGQNIMFAFRFGKTKKIDGVLTMPSIFIGDLVPINMIGIVN